MDTDEPEEDVVEDSTTADNILAWKELLSSKEAKEFIDALLQRSAQLFGQTHTAKIINLCASVLLMIVAFISIGGLAYLNLIPDATTGVLSGIVIGYFFKRGD
ncbi:hypothetical protein ACLD0W_03665 [Alloalcanivorax sp. C16-1]|uniref:hypothetical protein n=1 Tax=Alloalcanivorax sp. C16-1 TaxID=3390051 RepID=UPI003970D27A